MSHAYVLGSASREEFISAAYQWLFGSFCWLDDAKSQAWLQSVGIEATVMKGAKPEKRDDLLALAKKGYPEYEKPNALGACGGQVKVAPTNSWAPPTSATTKAQRVASAQALWPAPAPALKKTQDAELARIHKECEAYQKDEATSIDGFIVAHEAGLRHSVYYY